MVKKPVHHHSLVVAQCARVPEGLERAELVRFLNGLIDEIQMQVLIKPQVQLGPFGFTGIAGIVTSHIAFHYFFESRTLQLDIYSCKPYNLSKALAYADRFWNILSGDVTFIERSRRAVIRHYTYDKNGLSEPIAA
jgi:S-adenosylmethionine decarboxylase